MAFLKDGEINRPNGCNGFDIVIGNPPYIRRTSINENDKKYYDRQYKSATKQYDMYLLFIEQGMNMLNKKGHLCFINPIRFFNADYGFGCRKLLAENYTLKHVLDISQLPVFQNAMTYPCILLVQKRKGSEIVYQKLQNLSEIEDVQCVKKIFTNYADILSDPDFKFIVDVTQELRSLIKKINSHSKNISSLFDIARGLPNTKVNFAGNKYSAVKSTNVRKYFIEGELKTINTDFADIFSQEMIIMPRTVEYLQSMIKEKDIVCLDRIYYLIPTQKVNLKFVLGILNSRLTNFWFEFYYKTTKVQGNYFDLNGNQIGSIPLPNASAEQQKPIIALVDEILSAKKADATADTSELEKQIDELVYDLYGLSENERKIIDGR